VRRHEDGHDAIDGLAVVAPRLHVGRVLRALVEAATSI
jgi:hypothetical protein